MANAGPAQTVNEGETVTLDGSASSDADGDNIEYTWSNTAGIQLSNVNSVNPTFTAPDVTQATDYTFTLVVNESQAGSSPATVVITVSATTGGETVAEESFGEVVVYANNSATVVGNVTINGELAGEGDVVAIYVDEELRGKQAVTIDETGAYSAAGTAWLNALVNAAGGNESVTFQVYDASSGVTFEKSGTRVQIMPEGVAGSFAAPLLVKMDSVAPELTLVGEAQMTIDQGSNYVDAGASAEDNVDGDLTDDIVVSGEVDASVAGTYTLSYNVSDAAGNAAESVSRTVVVEKSTVVQSLSLKAGWNLVSFYVEPEDAAPATVLASIKDKLVQIKNLKDNYKPLPFPPFLNSLKELSVKEGYWLKVSEAVTLEVEGMVPAGASVTVKAGWNLVGYPRESGEEPASELASLGSTVVQIKNLKDNYKPLPFPPFLNSLKTMAPGQGYWLKVTEDGTWTVGDVSESGAGRDIARMGPGREMEKKAGPDWGRVVVYPNLSATVFAEVRVGGKAVGGGSVVGVYVGNELRGQHEVVLNNGRSYVTLNVNLEEAEGVTYRIWDGESGKEYGVSKRMTLEMGQEYGRAEALVKLDGVVPGAGVRILSYTRSPFRLEFKGEAGREYVVEATDDLKEWKLVRTLTGVGSAIEFTDTRKALFEKQYYRVRVVE